jgi:hypothetical protein
MIHEFVQTNYTRRNCLRQVFCHRSAWVELLIKFRGKNRKPDMIFVGNLLNWRKDGKDNVQWNLIMQEHRLKTNMVRMMIMRISGDLDTHVRV